MAGKSLNEASRRGHQLGWPTGWIVFDSDGRSWHGSSGSFSDSLGTCLSGQMLITYSVMNLGFVAHKEVGVSAQIRFRPKLVCIDALRGSLARKYL
jgi:hypothetical protein